MIHVSLPLVHRRGEAIPELQLLRLWVQLAGLLHSVPWKRHHSIDDNTRSRWDDWLALAFLVMIQSYREGEGQQPVTSSTAAAVRAGAAKWQPLPTSLRTLHAGPSVCFSPR